jgi:pimeloyl-ACP methyl ester carboxylesterase
VHSIETLDVKLPSGIHLACRAAGAAGRPVLMCLHGFPEAAFIWDDWLLHFSSPEHGGFRCIAPNLRGYAGSSAPAEVAAYHPRLLAQDVVDLTQIVANGPLAGLIAHDWGGAIAWNLASLQPQCIENLVIINAPAPASFVRELVRSPAQQAASAYMNFLARSDAPQRLMEDDYRRLWALFEGMGASSGKQPWLDEALRQRYRQAWAAGLHGPCAYYAASPLRPGSAQDLEAVSRAVAALPVVRTPTQLIWGLHDRALLPGLLDGLDQWVPDLRVHRLEDATHWVMHERPRELMDLVEKFLRRPVNTPGDGRAGGS